MPKEAYQNSGAPALSVVMPVHNGLPYLDAAVESVRAQTWSDFEFVILDDGSTDGSLDRLHEWAARDSRIRLLEAARNLGPAVSSQRVAEAAIAPIVARMDADDLCKPDRLEQQMALLRLRPDVGLVASLCDYIGGDGQLLRAPESWRLGRRSLFVPFAHGAIMYRREAFDRVGGYRQACEFWEDQDLISRIAAVSTIAVIPRALYQVRLSPTSTRISSEQERLERAVDLMYRSVGRLQSRRDYEDLLASQAVVPKLNPRVFVALGSQRLWAGGKPRLFRRLLRRGRLRLDLNSVSALAWTAWASASPATLRSFLRLLLLARNGFTATRLHGNPVEWRPPFTLPKDKISSPAMAKGGK